MRALPLLLLLVSTTPAQAATTALEIQERVGIEEHRGQPLPLDARFRDETATAHTLGEILNGRPAILALVYFDCPNLCSLTLSGLAAGLRRVALRAGRDFEIAAISIDPRETASLAAAKRAAYLPRASSQPGACPGCGPGWHFLTGAAPDIARVAGAVGYRYFWDSMQSQYAHPAGIVVVTATGRISQYFNGVAFPPRELEAALTRAAAGRSGGVAQRLWLLCFRYQALAGRYAPQIVLLLRILALATVAALAALLVRLSRRSA